MSTSTHPASDDVAAQLRSVGLRVTAPREPCYKFNAVMGYAQASRDMVQTSCCGFYLAVLQAGTIEAGQRFSLVPGRRALLVAEAFQARRIKHLR